MGRVLEGGSRLSTLPLATAPVRAPEPAGPLRGRRRVGRAVVAPLLAAAAVGVGLLLGWQGVDTAAQRYRVASFHAHGFALWDNQWFGGHWALSYSVIYPAVAAWIGTATVTIGAAALATLAFDRLAVSYLGRGATPAAVVFALGTVVQSAIGQWAFLAGEAVGLCACWAASRNRWATATTLAVVCSLASPLAGAFVAMAMAAWLLGSRRDTRPWPAAAVAVGAMAPVAAGAVLFPGQGRMPYPAIDYTWELAIAAGLWLIAGPSRRVLRAGALVFAVVATAAVVVSSPLGGNVGRIEDVLALPLAVGLLWPSRPPGWLQVAVLPLVAVPLVLSQWGPAWAAMTSDGGQPSTHPAYFAPLLAALTRAEAGGPPGRVEVVPTRFHWETVYVAPVLPLARGWERQVDEADNPLFYGGAKNLDDTTYRAWLLDNGVRFVALPDAPLDPAGTAEGRLVAQGMPGLDVIWRSAHWRLYRVDGSSGVVSAPARLVREDGVQLVVASPHAGPVLVRYHYSPDWELTSGAGCVGPAPAAGGGASWIRVTVPAREQFTLKLTLSPVRQACRAAG